MFRFFYIQLRNAHHNSILSIFAKKTFMLVTAYILTAPKSNIQIFSKLPHHDNYNRFLFDILSKLINRVTIVSCVFLRALPHKILSLCTYTHLSTHTHTHLACSRDYLTSIIISANFPSCARLYTLAEESESITPHICIIGRSCARLYNFRTATTAALARSYLNF